MTSTPTSGPEMQPWQIEATDLAEALGLTAQQATDAVVLQWLKHGDLKPFYDLVLQGYRPDPTIVLALAYMMARGDPDCTPSEEDKASPLWNMMPFSLVIKGKSRGPRQKPDIMTRNRLIAREVQKQMSAGVSYEGAIATVHEWYNSSVGSRIGVQTVRDAFDERDK